MAEQHKDDEPLASAPHEAPEGEAAPAEAAPAEAEAATPHAEPEPNETHEPSPAQTHEPAPAPVAEATPASAPIAKPAKPRRGAAFLWSLIGAIVGIGAVAGAGAGLPYYFGYPPDTALTLPTRFVAMEKQSQSDADTLKALATRLAALENAPKSDPALGALAARVAKLEAPASAAQPPAADPRVEAIAADDKSLAARVAKLEALGLTPDLLAALKAPPAGESATPAPGVADPRVDKLIQSEAALGARLSKVEAFSAPPAPDLSPLQGRLDKLEAALAAPKSETRVEPDAAARAENPAAAAVAALALQQRLSTGRAYAIEMATLTRLGAEPSALAPLQAFAETGAPTPAALAAEFGKVAAKVAVTPSAPPPSDAGESSGWRKWLAPFKEMIKAHPVSEVMADSPTTRAREIGAALARGDVAGALGEFDKLPPGSREAGKDWASRARAVADANAAAEAVFETALGRIATKKD